MQGSSTFATEYTGLTIVGGRTRSWDSFTKTNDRGDVETVEAGAKYYLQVVKVAEGRLFEIGEVEVDLDTYRQLESEGFGTVVNVAGEAMARGRQKWIKASAITVSEPTAV